NEVRISCDAPAGGASDDVMVGEVELFDRPRQELLEEAAVEVSVTDADRGVSLPCRITVADERGALVGMGNASDARHAVRPGVVYTADGRPKLSLAARTYTIYAGRGFEYSVDSAVV